MPSQRHRGLSEWRYHDQKPVWGRGTLLSSRLWEGLCGVGTLASPRQEGACPISANLRGQGDPLRSPWPLKFALMGQAPSCRGDASVPTPHNPSHRLSEHQTPTSSACSSGARVCPLTASSPHWSLKVTSRRARNLPRPRCKVRTWVGR